MGRHYRPRITRANLQAIVEQEFRDIEMMRRHRLHHNPEDARRTDPVVYSTDPKPLTETEVFLQGFRHVVQEDVRHPDTIGVSRRPEPRSIHSAVQPSRSIPRPKSPPKKPKGNGGKVELWRGNEGGNLPRYMNRHYGSGDKG